MASFSRFGACARGALLSAAVLCAVRALPAAEWVNLDEGNRLCGRMVSSGYLQGKVVMVYVGDFMNNGEAREQLKALEATWQCYRSRPFILLGSNRNGKGDEQRDATVEALKATGVTFPVYDGACLPEGQEPTSSAAAYFFIVDAAGRARFVNRDSHRAMEALVNWLANADSPATEKELKRLVEFETKTLPGRAWLRLKELKASDPQQAEPFYAEWDALDGDAAVKDVARLEEFARQAREYDPSAKKAKRISAAKVDRIIAHYEPLKACDRPELVQEIKNCLADLIWAKAAFCGTGKGGAK